MKTFFNIKTQVVRIFTYTLQCNTIVYMCHCILLPHTARGQGRRIDFTSKQGKWAELRMLSQY